MADSATSELTKEIEASEDKENLSDTLEEKPFLLDDNESADIGSLVLDDDDDEIMQD